MNIFYLFFALSPNRTWGNLIKPLQKKSADHSSETNFASYSITPSIYTSQIQHLPISSYFLSISTYTLELIPKPNPKEIYKNFRYFEFWELTRFIDDFRNLQSISGNPGATHHELINTLYNNKIGKLPVTTTSPIYLPLPDFLITTFLTDIDNTITPDPHTSSNSLENIWINIESKSSWQGCSDNASILKEFPLPQDTLNMPAHCAFSMRRRDKISSDTPTTLSLTPIFATNYCPASTVEVTTKTEDNTRDFRVGQA